MQVVDAEPTRTAAHRWISGWRFVLVVVVVAAITHLPGFVRTEVLNPDEAFLATQARVINDGGHLYRDVVDRKPPLVPYLYAATARITGSYEMVWVRLLAVAAHVATALLLAAIARRRWGEREAAFAAAALPDLVASGARGRRQPGGQLRSVHVAADVRGGVAGRSGAERCGAGLSAAGATLAKQVAATTMLPPRVLRPTLARDRTTVVYFDSAPHSASVAIAAALFGWNDFFFWVFTGTGTSF